MANKMYHTTPTQTIYTARGKRKIALVHGASRAIADKVYEKRKQRARERLRTRET